MVFLKVIAIPQNVVFVERRPLPKFPDHSADIIEYLQFLNPIMDAGFVSRSLNPQKQQNKLQFIIACLNTYRLVEDFPDFFSAELMETLAEQEGISTKLVTWLKFCGWIKNEYDLTEINSVGRFLFFQDVIEYTEKRSVIKPLIALHPKGEQDQEVGRPSFESERSVSSCGREDEISITTAALMRLLKNYLRARDIDISVNDNILRRLWNGSIVGQSFTLEQLEQTVCFFPIELGFLVDKENIIVNYAIGTSLNLQLQDLQGELLDCTEMIITHNHPRGTTFSLSDLVACAEMPIGEIRVVTILAEDPENISFKLYRAKILYQEGFDMKDLLNAFYLYFYNSYRMSKVLDDDVVYSDSAKYLENAVSTLMSLDLISCEGISYREYTPSPPEKLLAEIREDKDRLIAENKIVETEISEAITYLEQIIALS
ncbi:hypothetical protein HOC37_06700 [bacterium]|nr:hypothetical protein [bacterium]